MGFDGRAFGAEIVGAVKDYVGRALAPISARLDAIEARLDSLPAQTNAAEMADIVARQVRERVEGIQLPRDGIDGKDGKDADLGLMREWISSEMSSLRKMVSDELPTQIDAAVSLAVAELPPAKDGRDGDNVDPAEVRQMVASEVGDVLASWPRPKDGDPGEPGKDAEPVDYDRITTSIRDEVSKLPAAEPGRDGQDGQDGKDGKDAEPVDYDRIVGFVREAVAELPSAEPGKDGQNGKDAEPVDYGRLVDLIRDEVAKLPPAEPGKSVDVNEIREMVVVAVENAVKALPRPADGKTPSREELAALIDEALSAAIAAVPAPKDGVGLAGALIDREGNLVLTLSDGQICRLGMVAGRDGRDADMAQLIDVARSEIAKIPVPRDGKDGKDGRDGNDGLGYDDLLVDYDGERNVKLRFARGDDVREVPIRMPVLLYRGIHRDDASYERGDAVTYGGSVWIAVRDPVGKPREHEDNGWKLAVKAGRPGKDAEPRQAHKA